MIAHAGILHVNKALSFKVLKLVYKYNSILKSEPKWILTNTDNNITLISKELDSVPKYHIFEPT
jgi:hypothetical protein